MALLIAGFGNVLLGDDGFGVEVIRRLVSIALPSYVHVIDVGIGGMEMVLRLQDGFDELIIVDASRRGEAPGTLYVFSPKDQEVNIPANEAVNPHVAEPAAAMRMARQLGILPAKITVVGCEPESCALGIGLSPAVKAAVSEAVTKIRELAEQNDKPRAFSSPSSDGAN